MTQRDFLFFLAWLRDINKEFDQQVDEHSAAYPLLHSFTKPRERLHLPILPTKDNFGRNKGRAKVFHAAPNHKNLRDDRRIQTSLVAVHSLSSGFIILFS